MRLIDADVLKCEMQRLASDLEGTAESMGGQGLLCKRLNDLAEGVQRGIDMLNEQPTIEERKTGRWIWDDEGYHCSECLFHAYGETLSCLDGTFKYCPHCGAKMHNQDEEEEEDHDV